MNKTFCKHLRTKNMFTTATTEEAFADREEGQSSPCYFWCNLTQTVVGADDAPAHKNTCTPERRCFEA